MKKGTIALDIDGTITDATHMIPDGVASYFETLYHEGWQFILITGRIFSYAMMTLSKLNFPFFLGVQNGADLLKMPEKKSLRQCYLKKEILHLLEKKQEDFLVYAGVEKGDFCYYLPHKQSPERLAYLEQLSTLCPEPWQPLKSFHEIQQGLFPLIKCIGSKGVCEDIEAKLQEVEGIQTTVIKDPIGEAYYVALITHQEANKGAAALYFMENFQLARPLITGGDDNNDISLLKVGDVSIAMDGAPEALQNVADIMAPPAKKNGIIQGIQDAIDRT